MLCFSVIAVALTELSEIVFNIPQFFNFLPLATMTTLPGQPSVAPRTIKRVSSSRTQKRDAIVGCVHEFLLGGPPTRRGINTASLAEASNNTSRHPGVPVDWEIKRSFHLERAATFEMASWVT